MITEQIKQMVEAVAKTIPDRAVSIDFQCWVHFTGTREQLVQLSILPGIDSDCTQIHFRSEQELKSWIAEGCDLSVACLDADGIYTRIPEVTT